MTQLAPKQGLFAILMMVSFVLHLLVFVATGSNQESAHHQAHAVALTKELGRELVLPLSIDDRVGASVIVGRYSQDPAIAFIGVYDAQDQLIVPVGNQSQEGELVSHPINNGASIGKVVIQPSGVSRVAIFMAYWPYLFFMLIAHTLLWFFYAHLARPDDAYERFVYEEVRKRLIANGIPLEEEKITDNSSSTSFVPSTPQQDIPNKTNVDDEQDKKHRFGSLFDKLKTANDQSAQISESQDNHFSYYSTPQKGGEILYVWLTFIDEVNLLNMLEESAKNNYLALCNQLLDKTANKVLARPLLAGVRLEEIEYFTQKDNQWLACIKISRSSTYARLALAGAMIAKLLPTVHQVVYERHRDMNLFALKIKAIASDETRCEGAITLLQKRQEPSLLLLSGEDSNQVIAYFGLARHKEAVNLYEKECRIITNANDDMIKQMTELRNAILLQD